jgi:hypothetical protein
MNWHWFFPAVAAVYWVRETSSWLINSPFPVNDGRIIERFGMFPVHAWLN